MSIARTLLVLGTALPLAIATPGLAQINATGGGGAEAFTIENAILDTGILFAIGAREARQELRGSFGWPTFQEGLVQGVYFRFDPDGYARFAPTPRLDSDVFEVVCRPRTLVCMGRKDRMSMALTERGQIQLRLDGARENDRYFLADGVTEVELPPRILMPLDQQLEMLLAAGSTLVLRRGEEEIDKISLSGFSAVAAYLRWIAARQDYIVLPAGWPIPNGAGAVSDTMTQPATWASPMPPPQSFPAAPVTISPPPATTTSEADEELQELRELIVALAAQNAQAGAANRAGTVPSTTPPMLGADPLAGGSTAAPDLVDLAIAAGLPLGDAAHQRPMVTGATGMPGNPAAAQAEAETARLMSEIATLRQTLGLSEVPPGFCGPAGAGQAPFAAPSVVAGGAMAGMDLISMDDPATMERAHLMQQFGLDAGTADLLLQLQARTETTPDGLALPVAAPAGLDFQETLVTDILAALQEDLGTSLGAEMSADGIPSRLSLSIDPARADYRLLSDYVDSVRADTEAAAAMAPPFEAAPDGTLPQGLTGAPGLLLPPG